MIDIGDFGPDLALRDRDGKQRALYSQDIAGVSNALFFVEDKTVDGLAEAVTLIGEHFRAPAARAIAITPLSPNKIESITNNVNFHI